MASRTLSKDHLHSLLQTVAADVTSVLLSPSPHNNQYYYENFTNISLRALKYLNEYLNRINGDQVVGKVIDDIVKGFVESLKEYKGRNVFTHSPHEMQEHNQDDD